MEKLLTISVAAYNVEEFIVDLFESIIGAEMSDKIEVLVVNDGSQDQTLNISEKYSKLYPNTIRVINKINGGHGSTINTGIQEAHGKYFRALDGDDWLNTEGLNKLIKFILKEKNNPDIIISDYCLCSDSSNKRIHEFPSIKMWKQHVFDDIADDVGYMRYHTVIFRTDILKNHYVPLDEKCFYVDTEFMLYYIPYIKTIFYFGEYLYCYRIGLSGQSVSTLGRIRHIKDSRKVVGSLFKYYKKYSGQLNSSIDNYFVRQIAETCIWYIESVLLLQIKKKNYKKILSFIEYIKLHYYNIYIVMVNKSKKVDLLKNSYFCLYVITRRCYIIKQRFKQIMKR